MLEGLAQERSEVEVAREIPISHATMERVIAGLKGKLGVETLFALGVQAARAGLISEDGEQPRRITEG